MTEPYQQPPPPQPQRPAARGSCGLAFACVLFSIMLGMFGIGGGFSMLLMAAGFIFAVFSGLLYVMNK